MKYSKTKTIIIIIIIFSAVILLAKKDLYIRNNHTKMQNNKGKQIDNSRKDRIYSSLYSLPRNQEDYQIITDNNLFQRLHKYY